MRPKKNLTAYVPLILSLIAGSFPGLLAAAVTAIPSTKITEEQLTVRWWVQGEDAKPATSAELQVNGKTITPVTSVLAPDPTQPLCYLFITDTSLSMKRQLQTAVIPLLNTLLSEKPAQHWYRIGRFDERLELLSPFADDIAVLTPAVQQLKPKGQRTELFRSALQGLKALQECNGYRRVLVLLSDGDAEDLPDAYSLDDVVNNAREQQISIITLGFKDSIKLQNLRRLAEETGGWHWLYKAEEIPDLAKKFKESTDTGGVISVKIVDLPPQTDALTLQLTLTDQQQLNTLIQLPAPLNIVPPIPLSPWQAWFKQHFPGIPVSAWPIGLAILLGLLLLMLVLRRRKHKNLISEEQSVLSSQQKPLATLKTGDQVFIMKNFSISIGALPDNDWVLDDPTVSRHQASIDYKDKVFYLTDRGSTNSSQINGETVQHSILENGDTLQFGDWQGVFEIL